MTREEFEQTVREMQNEGVPITMANLMVRTELPRAQIETWLDAMQRDVRFKPPARPTDKSENDAEVKGGSIIDRARALEREVLGEAASAAIKSKLGLSGDEEKKSKRDLKRGAVLGAALPPAGLLYSAPWKVGAGGTAVYAVLAWLAITFPMIGIPYVLIPLHLVGGVLGGAYAWRYNRCGKRAPLLPSGPKKAK